jgi:hypothetical protein
MHQRRLNVNTTKAGNQDKIRQKIEKTSALLFNRFNQMLICLKSGE